jgi:hypothetical protein
MQSQLLDSTNQPAPSRLYNTTLPIHQSENHSMKKILMPPLSQSTGMAVKHDAAGAEDNK